MSAGCPFVGNADMYRGTTRKREIEVLVDGLKVATWTSSGTSDGPESINIMEASGQVVSIQAVLHAWQWISVVEVSLPATSSLAFLALSF